MSRRPSAAVSLVLGGTAAAFIVAYLVVAFARYRYPYELELLESGLLAHVRRINSGQPIYVAPNASFVAYPYPPLYVYLAALVSHVIGPSLRAMRVVSLTSSIAVLVLLGDLVRRETGRIACGVICAGLFAATFKTSGAWFDLGRVDSLFLALTVGALAAARRLPELAGRRPTAARAGAVGAALLLALALLTKQTAIFAAPPILWWLARSARPRLWAWWLGAFVAVAGGVCAAFEVASHGWFLSSVLGQLAGHRLLGPPATTFWTTDLGRTTGLAAVGGVAGLVATAVRGDPSRRLAARHFWLPTLASLLGAAWISRVHEGGYNNVLMPAFAAIALAAGLGLGAALDLIDQHRVRPRPLTAALAAALVAAGLFQAAHLRYSPARLIPTAADRQAGEQFTAYVRGLPGTVWIPLHGIYAELADKGDAANSAGITDVVLSGNQTASRPLLASVHAALATHHYSAILLDGPRQFEGFPTDFASFYQCRPLALRVPLAYTERTSPDRICTPR